ncbi:MAG: phosphatidylserine synthase [Deltaproteobacteria bacterium]|nr:phosphatidylserine synthase [Deltaproteobacteria bacterium]
METLLTIIISAAIGTIFFIWFSRAVKKSPAMRAYIMSHQWLLHPNSICYWRAGMAILGFVLYFVTPYQAFAIFIFTFAAILDGVDGVVARGCNLGTVWGEWLDPMCDKLTYLPPLIGFAFTGILSMKLVLILTAIEFSGQIFARKVLSSLKISVAANNFGKIKAIICFALVILCALLDKNPGIINFTDSILLACIALSTASVVFKFIPNRFYADILSGLNFICGIISLVLTYHHKFAWAISVIIAGQLFDLFDGRMALKHGGTRYGPYMDDIADFVSFGLAPAYVIIEKAGGYLSYVVAAAYILSVAFRLIRFVTTDKHRTDLPAGIFNGLPRPAGAMIVLGAALVAAPPILWTVTCFAIILMVSHIRFAHLGRVILRKIPRPLFFVISAGIIVTVSLIFKTKSPKMFGYLILSAIVVYMITALIQNKAHSVPTQP